MAASPRWCGGWRASGWRLSIDAMSGRKRGAAGGQLLRNCLYRGDCLRVLRQLQQEGVRPDLIYLDPPFNSHRIYNFVFRDGGDGAEQVAFSDMWAALDREQLRLDFEEFLDGASVPEQLKDFIDMWVNVLLKGGGDDRRLLNYLLYMSQRLLVMKETLSPTGSIYLHCDRNASHYLKVMMDAIFGRNNFRNEIVWCYPPGGVGPRWGFHNKHDTLLFYGMNPSKGYFQRPYTPLTEEAKAKFTKVEKSTGRRYKQYPNGKSYLDKSPGRPIPSWWTDIPSLGQTQTGSGYATEKPPLLLERIVAASCPPNGLVLDPFCGCGTTIDAAEKLKRRWIGVDISSVAVDFMLARMRDKHSLEEKRDYDLLHCDPETMLEYAKLSPYDKQKFLVTRLGGVPGRRGGDGGVDGEIKIHIGDHRGKPQWGKFIISVKTGKQAQPAHVDQLVGAMSKHNAVMGGLILDRDPTPGMNNAAGGAGKISYKTGACTSISYRKVQILTAEAVLEGERFEKPPTMTQKQLREKTQGKL